MRSQDWAKLHKSMCNQYEDLALADLKKSPSTPVDPISIIAKVVERHLPDLGSAAAAEFVGQAYQEFKRFDLLDVFKTELRSLNPKATDQTITAIFEKVRGRLLDTPDGEHESFLYFVISKIIHIQRLSISRAWYLTEIARDRMPQNSKIVQFFRRWRQFAIYAVTKDGHAKRQGGKN